MHTAVGVGSWVKARAQCAKSRLQLLHDGGVRLSYAKPQLPAAALCRVHAREGD